MSSLQANCCLKLDFLKMDKQTGGHGTKHDKGKQL